MERAKRREVASWAGPKGEKREREKKKEEKQKCL
jgi:hypothetical protein